MHSAWSSNGCGDKLHAMRMASALLHRSRPARFVAPCLLGAFVLSSGCFRAEPEAPGDEARAVAEALTRSLSFDDGNLEDGDMPPTDDDTVLLLPLEETVVMEPGGASVMPFSTDNPNDSDDPVTSTLVQFGPAGKHFEISTEIDALGTGSDALRFSVASNVCENLCNKRFSVDVRQRARTSSGKIGRTATRTVQLECSERGKAKFCAKASSGSLEQRVVSKLSQCGLVERVGNLNVEMVTCAWECLADADCSELRATLCGGGGPGVDACLSSRCTSSDIGQFRCADGELIDLSWQCDGESDCTDGSDERSCASTTFSCDDGLSIPQAFVCDLERDCSDGSDEAGCTVLSCGDDVGGNGGFGGGGNGGFGGGEGGSGGEAGRAGFGGMGGSGGNTDGGTGGSTTPPGFGTTCTTSTDCPSDAPLCVGPEGLGLLFCSVPCDDTTVCPALAGMNLICSGGACNLSFP
jgi:hypothetical protein